MGLIRTNPFIQGSPCVDNEAEHRRTHQDIANVIGELNSASNLFRTATATAKWVDGSPPTVAATDDASGDAISIQLTRIGEGDPNIQIGHVIMFVVVGVGAGAVNKAISNYMGEKILSVKEWSGTAANVPDGWAIMNGSDNAIMNGGSGIDCTDRFIKGIVSGSAGTTAAAVTGSGGGHDHGAATGTGGTGNTGSGTASISVGSTTSTMQSAGSHAHSGTSGQASYSSFNTGSNNGGTTTVDANLDGTTISVPVSPHNHTVTDTNATNHTHALGSMAAGGSHSHTMDSHSHTATDAGHTHSGPSHSHTISTDGSHSHSAGTPASINLYIIERIP